MPTLRITVPKNFLDEATAEDLCKKFSAKLAEMTQKPEKFVQVQWDALPVMLMGGTTDLCAKIEVGSIGLDTMLKGGLQAVADLNGPVLANMLVQSSPLIDVKRVYVTFGAPAAAAVVWDGTSFATRKAAGAAGASQVDACKSTGLAAALVFGLAAALAFRMVR